MQLGQKVLSLQELRRRIARRYPPACLSAPLNTRIRTLPLLPTPIPITNPIQAVRDMATSFTLEN